MFSRLTLNNWRQFSQINIEFHPRLTVLTGANGSGICSERSSAPATFALYGRPQHGRQISPARPPGRMPENDFGRAVPGEVYIHYFVATTASSAPCERRAGPLCQPGGRSSGLSSSSVGLMP
jgi:hypothetical protein